MCCDDYACQKKYQEHFTLDDLVNSYSRLGCNEKTTVLILYGTCIFLSGWFLLTGIFPICMTDSKRPRWKCLKITFMVFSIISAVIFCPSMFTIGILSVSIIKAEEVDGDIITVSGIIDACAVIEMIVAITSATYCCCCSQILPANEQNVVIFNPVQEQVLHSMTQLQGPYVNQQGVLIPQGYQQQQIMPGSHVQIIPQQVHGQVLPQSIQGQQYQQNNGMVSSHTDQQPAHVCVQPGLEHQPSQGVNGQQQM
ncbi:uncharacterized protein LOC127711184 isoform X3 [Mytilus californianus]|uniref:uncharacterized protein LOC127711184 isoform X3 n=1 Tax=Mytilus californianus TaxID=6549 RepID=UPI002246CAC6|nr:uncharacterized protein LOC127711184 isoform X3 [Mytilus californianus]